MHKKDLSRNESDELKTLLDGMNIGYSPEQINVELIEYMIDEVLYNFNCSKVRLVMNFLGWEWKNKEVTTEMVEKSAKRLLYEVVNLRLKDFKEDSSLLEHNISSGGLTATVTWNQSRTKVTHLDLKFTLEEYTARLDKNLE